MTRFQTTMFEIRMRSAAQSTTKIWFIFSSIREVTIYSLTSNLTFCYVSMATDQAEWRKGHVTFDVDQQKCRIDNRQLSETECAEVPVRIRKCVNVDGRQSKHFS
jgi:hypothetical protein